MVVLPAPFGPRKAKISPLPTSKEMSSTAVNSPNRFTRFLHGSSALQVLDTNGSVQLSRQLRPSGYVIPHDTLQSLRCKARNMGGSDADTPPACNGDHGSGY